MMREIQHGAIVQPRAEFHFAVLGIERKIGHVYFASAAEGSRCEPGVGSVRIEAYQCPVFVSSATECFFGVVVKDDVWFPHVGRIDGEMGDAS